MTLLSAISVLCFFVMLYVAIAVAQTIRARRVSAAPSKTGTPTAPREFFEAGDYRRPGSLRLIQQIDQRVAERSNISPPTVVPQAAAQIATLQASAAGVERANSFGCPPMMTDTSLINRGGIQPRTTKSAVADPGISERRQSHQPLPQGLEGRKLRPQDRGFVERRQAREGPPNGVERRADRAHYNKDMGDLTDPYTQAGRPLGDTGRSPDHSRMTATMSRLTERDQPEN